MSDAEERSHAGQTQEAEGDIGRGAWSPASLSEVKGIPIATLRTAVQQRLGAKQPGSVGDEAWEHTKRLYARFQQSPLWFEKGGLDKDRVEALTNALLGATDDGLRIDDYPLSEVAHAISAVRATKQPTAEQLADADVLLTAAYASLGEDLLVGQVDPKTVGQSWHIDARDENVDSALVRTLVKQPLDKAINAMRPNDEEYVALQKELVRFREVIGKGGWKAIPAGKALKRGQTDSPERLAALRDRLQAEGITVPGASSSSASSRDSASASRSAAGAVFDDGLASAIAEFQARHGINVDSSLGKETVDALNVPAEYRLGQIAANLERHRWLPRALGMRYIFVNVPGVPAPGVRQGRAAAHDEGHRRPGVRGQGDARVLGLDGDGGVPSLLERDARHPGEGDRAEGRGGPGLSRGERHGVLERQRRAPHPPAPGPKNSLGYVKFLFPNDFNIYLHDTPNHELFEKDVRAFSHGCIRVEKPAELAQWVLGWDASKVDEAMRDGSRQPRA
jgi:murein L,D-transpeptidase YcbB/YkuD